MTLIATFSIDKFWFMLGDLLLSGPKQANQPLHLPSVGDSTPAFPPNARFFPSGLARKVCHFNNAVVAWGGHYFAAKVIIGQLFTAAQVNGSITPETLENVYSNLDPWIQKEMIDGKVGLLGYLLDSYNSTGFGINYSELNSSILQNARIYGSGSKLFQSYFDHKTQSGLEFFAGIKEGGFEAALCKALGVTGMLLQLELSTHKTLLNHFGGSYELVSIQNNRVVLCDDLMYAFWFASIDNKGITISPVMKFFKQSYFQDTLIIRTLEMKSPDPNNPAFLTERNDEVHYFPPMYRDLTQQEISTLPIPDLNAFMLCSYILVQSHTGIEVLTKFDWSKKREMPLRFVDDGDHMVVQIQEKHIDDILSSIESRSG